MTGKTMGSRGVAQQEVKGWEEPAQAPGQSETWRRRSVEAEGQG